MRLPIEDGGWDLGIQYQQFNGSSNSESGGGGSRRRQFKNIMERILRKNAKSHKVSLLITSAFSLAAALLVILMVLHDARAVQRRSFSLKKRTQQSLWKCIHKAEVMPLAIAISSLIQSCIFLGVQSQTVSSIWISGCTLTAQLIWPALWIVAFTVTAFSLESTFRSLQANRFGPRRKLHLLVSVVLVILFLLATLITARVLPSDDICWGSLVWWTIHFVQPSIALGAGIILVNLVIAAVLVAQLIKTAQMDRDERIAASRVVYSLGINVLILALTLPFFITFTLGDLNKKASLMADSVSTLNGLLHGVVHLFLRTNSEPLAIRPRDTPWTRKRTLRLFGPNDLNIHNFISTPIVAERDVERNMLYTGMDKKLSVDESHNGLPRQQIISIHPDVPPPPFSVATASKKINLPAPSYSVFPIEKANNVKNLQVLASEPVTRTTSPLRSTAIAQPRPPVDSVHTIYSTDDDPLMDHLQPPKPLFLNHRRNDSETRSAIVEIALRLSTAPSDADSVYIPEQIIPMIPAKPVKLTRGPSLLSPDRYVPAAKLAEAAKSRPVSPRTIKETADIVSVQKPEIGPKLIGLPKNPQDNKRNLQQTIRDSIAARILNRQSMGISKSTTNKKLPPVPDREQPLAIAALQALIKSSHPLVIAPVKQAIILPVPDWRQAAIPPPPQQQQNTMTMKNTELPLSSEAQDTKDRKSNSPPDGWL